ncbi:hypothetical protein [Fluviicola sp.]|uniref:hypothetical protein n=1 Tax=Fluviicola sp. TaxID=1917219 RepID=UPI0026239866|nr:hypothetical protein [Fluviicola sp.]
MKNKEYNPLDRLLKERLAEGTKAVPDFVWDRIENELFPKRKRRFFFWWFFGGICMLLSGVLFMVVFSGGSASSQVNNHKVSGALKHTSGLTAGDGQSKPEKRTFILSGNYRKASSFSKSRHQPNLSQSVNASHKHQRSGVKLFSGRHISSNPVLSVQHSNTAFEKSGSGQTILTQTPDFLPVNADSLSKNAALSKEVLKTDSSGSSALSYAEIIALLERDFPAIKEPEAIKKNSKSVFSLGVYSGLSLFNTATFKDYFTSGQLSKRSFASSGFELGLQGKLYTGKRFGIYAGLAFNQKQTQFMYDLAITESDYFSYIATGEKIPLQNIRDDGSNSCFLAKDVSALIRMRSTILSVGTTVELFRTKLFSVSADFRLSGNIRSDLTLKKVSVLDIPQPNSERFSYLQPGIGIQLNYRLSPHISLGFAPSFSKQFYLKQSFSRKMDEILVPIFLTVHF